jgi:phosphoribosylpyrophosphate synthetase
MKPLLFALGNFYPRQLVPNFSLGRLRRAHFPGGHFSMEIETAGESSQMVDEIILWATKIPGQSPAERFLEMVFSLASLKKKFPNHPLTLAHAYYDGGRGHLSPAAIAQARLFRALPMDRQWLFDLHDEAILGEFSVPTLHLPSLPLWAAHIRETLPRVDLILSPDRGRRDAVGKLGQYLGLETLYWDKKNPPSDSGESLEPKVRGRHGFLFDDEIISGKTLVGAIQRLTKWGIDSLDLGIIYPLCSIDILERLRHMDKVLSLTLGDFIHQRKPLPGTTLSLAGPLLQSALKR